MQETTVERAPGRDDRATQDTRATHLLFELVSTPSVSRDEARCAALLAARMGELGYRATIDESGSVIGEIGSTASDAVEIVLLGHIDTVPGDLPVRIADGKLHGRGSVDAKGPLAAFVIAAAMARLPANVRLRVIGAVEEEIATSAGARLAAAMYRPAACIIGEPSGVDGVTLGYKGRVLADLRVTTDNSHSAGPDKTAAEIACEVWRRIAEASRAARPDSQRVFDSLQARLRTIGCSDDGLTTTADMRLCFRLPPGIAPGDVEQLCAAATRDIGVEYRWVFNSPEIAHVADRSNAVARALGKGVREMGMSPRMKLKTGTSDMNVVGPIWKCPIAAYGPGDSSLDHTPGEHIDINEYLLGVRVLVSAIEALSAELAPQPARPRNEKAGDEA